MDRALTREESKQLMELLGLPMAQYGNLPAMRKAFLQKCKVLHPDKGGNEEQMKTLMSLYKKLDDHLKDIQDEEFWAHSWRPEEVGADCCPVDSMYMQDWDVCSTGRSKNCYCLMCRLRVSHKLSKGNLCCRPNCWIKCYCFECFREWFGADRTYEAFLLWVKILGETPMREINL
ncbi:small T antigen [Miniopterus schreibersi polyomavirus 3]|nr:small T antigen [Miniopterus schreibersi polyomavirus 3]